MARLDAEVRERSWEYLAGRLALNDFEDWLIRESDEEPVDSLAVQVDHLLMERSVDHEDEFRDSLRDLVMTIWPAPGAVQATSNSVTLTYDLRRDLGRDGSELLI